MVKKSSYFFPLLPCSPAPLPAFIDDFWVGRVLGLLSCLVVWGGSNFAIAEIVPDNTLPNNSQVTAKDNIRNISGGTQQRSNLFHSFTEFSVPTGTEAHFNNALSIQNIISRVTGKSISNIDGILKANGNANLFLINPSGIIFGQNAKLDIGGSFFATTANAIQFGDRGIFSASNPENLSPLLTVNPDALLFNQIKSAAIQNNSVAPSGLDPSKTFTAKGLRVPDGQSLFLVGGNVSMDGGGLFAFGGRVELGGVASGGTVGLNGSFPDKVTWSDVSLTNGANVNVRANNGGSIAIHARNLEMRGSSLLAGIGDGLGSVNNKAGNIDINAQSEINLKEDSEISNFLQSKATGDGGDINITTGSLSLKNGGRLRASTLGRGNGGNITIIARDNVSFDGTSSRTPSAIFIAIGDLAVGNGGDININTNSLDVTNGAVLTTYNYGRGNAGTININARDRVRFDGVGNTARFLSTSGAYSSIVIPEAIGNGGDINITTNLFSVTNGARLSARSFGQGNAGSIAVTARAVKFDGVRSDGDPGGAFTSVQPKAVGNGGNIRITTDSLSVSNSSQLSASNDGQGIAGDIEIHSGSIRLWNQAGILAKTASGNGGNITLGNEDLLVLRRNSQISTTAGTAQAGGNGGNITINTPKGFIVANNGENSNITANAFTGKGGNVQINATGIYGIQLRQQEKPESSDITASSQFGAKGTVTINTLKLDPSQGLINLPTETREGKLAQSCESSVAQNQSQFIITGRGGLPPNPKQVLRNNNARVAWVSFPDASVAFSSLSSPSPHVSPSPIIEAQGWMVDANGDLYLVASSPNITPHSPQFSPASCGG